jgi:hypothetical protein
MAKTSRGIALSAALILSIVDSSAFATCGEHGGPGYRAPNGRCVGWDDVDKTCGKPPTTRCSPEHVNVANPSQSPSEARRSDASKLIEAPRPTAPVAIEALPPSVPRAGVLPDKDLTGGSVRTDDRDAACGHARESRGQMNAARQDKILRRYGLPAGTHPDYEIDHLIPLCLGGSDDDSNLWPQPRRSKEETWNAEAKDRLERLMCDMVCAGQVDIATAQEAFATDWIAAYHAYYEGKRKRLRREPIPPD